MRVKVKRVLKSVNNWRVDAWDPILKKITSLLGTHDTKTKLKKSDWHTNTIKPDTKANSEKRHWHNLSTSLVLLKKLANKHWLRIDHHYFK